MVVPRQKILLLGFLSHSGSHGSRFQYCSSGVHRMSLCTDILAIEKTGCRVIGRGPGHAVKPASKEPSSFSARMH